MVRRGVNGPFTAPPVKSAPDDELALRRNQNAAWFGGTDGTSNTVPSLPFASVLSYPLSFPPPLILCAFSGYGAAAGN